jgi:ankyrin repeat protein
VICHENTKTRKVLKAFVLSCFRDHAVLLSFGACCLWTLPLLSQQRDVRLLEAVKRRDQKAFTALLKARADVNAAQPDGATALAWAVHLGQRSMAMALLDSGANVNTADEYGETPVTLAAANGDEELVRRLIAAGGNARAARWNGETTLMIAAGAGSLDTVRELVRHGADVNATEPRGGQTALMWAAAEGHGDVVAGLVEIGANVNAASKTGFTPLVFAAIKNDGPSIKTLLQAGANPNVVVLSGAKPIIVAQQYRNTAAALLLLEGGADINARDRAGNTTLHLAAQAGDMNLVRALLAKRADANARTPKSMAPVGARGGGGGGRGGIPGEQTPLMMAARGDHEDVMRALVAAGADPTLRAQDGSSVLMTAAGGARIKTFSYAYEIDPSVDVVTTTGNTPMHAVVSLNGRTQPEVCEVIQFLADHAAKLDEMNGAGRTPIAIADGQPIDLAVDLLTKLLTERGEKPKIASKR